MSAENLPVCYTPAVTWEEIIGLSLALIVMLVALVGNVVPGIPGTPLALIAAVAHRLYFGQSSVNNTVLFVLILLAAIALVFDFLGSALGAKKFGATWRGVVGAVVGGIAGWFGAGKKQREELKQMKEQFTESFGGMDELEEELSPDEVVARRVGKAERGVVGVDDETVAERHERLAGVGEKP